MEPHQRSAKARQAIDLLIRAQFYVVEASILASPPIAEAGVRSEAPCAEVPRARERAADEVALAVEPSFASARDAGNLDVPLEDDDPGPAIRPSFRDRVCIRWEGRQHALWRGRANACRRIGDGSRRLAFTADLVRSGCPQVDRGE